MQLVKAADYPHTLCKTIQQAQHRVVLAAMQIMADDGTEPIFMALAEALQRGIQVHIMVDVFYRALLDTSQRRRRRRVIAQTDHWFARLQQLGATVVVYGKLGLNPFKGRSHLKITVIDDAVFSFGGINCYGEAFNNIDYMLYTVSPKLADYLTQLVAEAPANPQDTSYTLDANNTILFDGGRPGQSLIYDQACILARQAKRIYYVSQMAPSGRLATLLKATSSKCYFNRPGQASFFVGLSLLLDQRRHGLANHYKGTLYLHAKCILFEMANGERTLLTGSHNFSWRGVAYGTQEVALLSTDDVLWQNIYSFLQTSVNLQ